MLCQDIKAGVGAGADEPRRASRAPARLEPESYSKAGQTATDHSYPPPFRHHGREHPPRPSRHGPERPFRHVPGQPLSQATRDAISKAKRGNPAHLQEPRGEGAHSIQCTDGCMDGMTSSALDVKICAQQSERIGVPLEIQ